MTKNLKSNSRGTALPLVSAVSFVSTVDVEFMSRRQSTISTPNSCYLLADSIVHITQPISRRSAISLTNVRKHTFCRHWKYFRYYAVDGTIQLSLLPSIRLHTYYNRSQTKRMLMGKFWGEGVRYIMLYSWTGLI